MTLHDHAPVALRRDGQLPSRTTGLLAFLPDFVKNGTQMSEDGVELQFEVVHRLRAPDEWWHLTVPFKEGQTEVVLSRKLRFGWPLRTEGRRAPLDGELTLVLRKSP